ncbi:MAG: hypothetical protein ACI4I6_06185 [Hominimerdicola sp.]
MKRIAAIMVSLIMTCTIAAGCSSSDDSSSKADASAASSNTIAEGSKASEKGMAEEFTDMLNSNNYTVTLSSSDMTMTISYDGTNSYIKMEMSGESVEMYTIDNVSYTLDEATKTYYTSESEEMTISAEDSVGLPEEHTFVSSETTDDGMTCETYTVPTGDTTVEETESTDESTASTETSVATLKYYFDSEGTLVKAESQVEGETVTVEVISYEADSGKIELPDLSNWEKMDFSDLYTTDSETTEDETTENESSTAEAE